MKKVLLTACALWLALTTTAAHAGLITSAGSTTVQPVMKACATAYRMQHPDTRVIIAGGGSSKGVKTVARKRVDIGRASRPIKAKEMNKYPDLNTFQVGTDGIAIVTHADNPLTGLSDAQVKQIYSGEISNWKQIGGNDAPVHLISLGTEHGTYELFSKYFHLKGTEVDGSLHFANGIAWIAFSQDVALEKLAKDKSAIAFVSIGIGHHYATTSGKIKLLPLNGIDANEQNVANGSYKLSRPLLLLTMGKPAGAVKDFIDFTLGQQCQAIVKKLGYIPVR